MTTDTERILDAIADLKRDIAELRELVAPPVKPPRKPKISPPATHPNTTRILEAYKEAVGLVSFPRDGKSTAVAKRMAWGGVTPESIGPLYRWLMSDEWWKGRGADLATLEHQYPRWVSAGSPGADEVTDLAIAARIERIRHSRDERYRGSTGQQLREREIAALYQEEKDLE